MRAASRVCAITSLLLVALAIAPPRLRADGAKAEAASAGSSSSQVDRATARHRAGVRAFAHHRYREAIALFREANRLRPSAALSFNIARCYEELGDEPNTLVSYREYLRRADHPDDEAQVIQIVHELEARLAPKHLQQISVSSTPSGAAVSIDGTSMGISPWSGELAPGQHIVQLTRAGYEPVQRRFVLESAHALTLGLDLPLIQTPAQVSSPQVVAAAPAVEVAQATKPATEQAAPASPPPRPRPPEDLGQPRDQGVSTAGWVALGAGGAALGAALAFEVMRHSSQKDAEHETMQIRFARDLDRMRSQQLTARVLVGVGAGLAAVGGVLLVVGASSGESAPSTRVAWSCATAGCLAQITGRF